MLSKFTVGPSGALAGSVGLSLFSRALDSVPGLHGGGWWLVTDSGPTFWTGSFTRTMRTAGLVHALEVQASNTAAFLAVALVVWFSRADVSRPGYGSRSCSRGVSGPVT